LEFCFNESYVCGDERGNIQLQNRGVLTINADCIARSPITTLQGHPAIRSTIEKKPATIATHSIERPRQVSRQDTTMHNKTADKLNHLQGEIHQLQEQQERGNLETTSKIQGNYVKIISIATGLEILLLLAAIFVLVRQFKYKRVLPRERHGTEHRFSNTNESAENAHKHRIIHKKNFCYLRIYLFIKYIYIK